MQSNDALAFFAKDKVSLASGGAKGLKGIAGVNLRFGRFVSVDISSFVDKIFLVNSDISMDYNAMIGAQVKFRVYIINEP